MVGIARVSHLQELALLLKAYKLVVANGNSSLTGLLKDGQQRFLSITFIFSF